MDPRLEEILKRRLTNPRSSTPVPKSDNLSQTLSVGSDTALVVDKWGMRRGQELATEQFDALLMADCHTAMFEPSPQLADNPADKLRGDWFRELMQSEEYASLHATTALNDTLSQLAAKKLAEKFSSWHKRVSDPRKKDDTKSRDREEIERMRSVCEALDESTDECDTAISVARGMGEGVFGNEKINLDKIINSYKRVTDNGELRRIFEIAGRLRRFARAAQASKIKHGYDDMVGVKLDGNPAHFISAELCKLGIEELELDLLRRTVDRQVMSRQYEGEQPTGQGPVVVVVDESGSMGGPPVESAKALALTMGWVALHQKRWITFIGYSGGCAGNLLTFKPGKWNQGALLDWLVHFYSGGSCLDLPIEQLPSEYWAKINPPKGVTDLLFITDAQCSIGPRLRDKFLKWKAAEKVRAYGITLGDEVGQLELICDATWSIPSIDLSEAAIKQVLAI